MLKGKRFICDYCNKSINTQIVIEVDSVVAEGDREHRHCRTTGEHVLYFHLASSQHAPHYKDGGCYKQWVMSGQCFNPHNVRTVLKQKVLEKLAQNS